MRREIFQYPRSLEFAYKYENVPQQLSFEFPFYLCVTFVIQICKMETIKTEAFELALKFINETNVNIFLTGKAGTGKTTFLKYLKENPVKNMAVAAPTGVAAINAGGITLHSMFHLPFGPFIPANRPTTIAIDKKTLLSRLRYNSEKLNFFNALELLVIDEASMVASYTVDEIDLILRTVRHKQAPFGGVQVLFIGDLYQLQPVVRDNEWKLLKEYYSSNFFFDSLVLKANIPVMVELKKIFRQKDESFIDILNGLRENTLTKQHLLALNSRMKSDFISKDGDGYITLTTHNANANKINEIKLNNVKKAEFKYEATIEDQFPDHIVPAEKILVLKEGAQVMFIKNDPEKRFFNGKIGIVEDLSDDEVVVNCNGDKINVNRYIWENVKYAVDPDTKEIKESVIGTFTQYPLRLAWAITIHKSQGLTFDKVVIDAENAFANGQVYVALSRATSLEGLILTSPVNDRFLGPHADLKSWQETKHDEKSLPVLFEKAREEYLKQVLFGVFSYEQFLFYLIKLNKEISEFLTDDSIRKWLREFSGLHENLLATSNKFKQQLQEIWNEGGDPATNEKLQVRVSEASKYFSEQLVTWKNIFLAHPIKISNKRTARSIDKVLEELNEQMVYNQTKTDLCKSGFSMNDLSVWKKNLPANFEKVKSTYISSAMEGVSGEKSELFELLSSYRDEMAEEEDVPPYMIFSNQTIRNCCAQLPGDESTMLAMGGFGRTKLSLYGFEVLKMIRRYCEENSIELNYSKGNQKGKVKGKSKAIFKKSGILSVTVNETIVLIKSGNSIKEVCAIRKLAESTIEGHLALAVQNNLIQIETVMEVDMIEKIRTFFPDNSTDLKAAREMCGNKYSFGKLKLVQAWLIAKKLKEFAS